MLSIISAKCIFSICILSYIYLFVLSYICYLSKYILSYVCKYNIYYPICDIYLNICKYVLSYLCYLSKYMCLFKFYKLYIYLPLICMFILMYVNEASNRRRDLISIPAIWIITTEKPFTITNDVIMYIWIVLLCMWCYNVYMNSFVMHVML